MVYEDVLAWFLPSQIPLHYTLTFIVSYILWSKFLNESDLKPKKIEGVIELIAVFLTVFATFVFIYYSFSIIFYINNPHWIFSSQNFENSIYSFLVYVLIVVVLTIRYKPSGNELNELLYKISIFCLGLIVVILGFVLFISWTNLEAVFAKRITNLFFVLILIPLLYYALAPSKVFGPNPRLSTLKTQKDDPKRKLFTLLILGVLILGGFTIPYFTVPQVSSYDMIREYQLLGKDRRPFDGLANELVRRQYFLTEEGLGFKLIALNLSDINPYPGFHINYTHYNSFDGREYFKGIYVDEKSPEIYKDYGILDFQNVTYAILAKIDKDRIKEKNVNNFYVTGTREVNINDKFSIEGPGSPQCGNIEGECRINLTFVNNLDHRVTAEDLQLLDYSLFHRACVLMNSEGFSIFKGEKSPVVLDNSSEYYEFSSRKWDSFRISIQPNDIKFRLEVNRFRIEPHTELHLTLIYDCK